jgi:hypothetical protein
MSDQTEITKDDKTTHKLQSVWPTLFIGIGGTGMEISLRIRRRLLNYVWGGRDNPVRISNLTEFPLAQFINFDLDAGSVTASGQSAATDPLADLVKFADEEKLIFKLDMDKYLRTDGELNRYPHIASWFPLTRKKTLELGIDPSKGAGQIRALSRLYFFDKYVALKNMIEDKIRVLLAGVSSLDKTERLGLKLEPASLRVVVLASCAGGTGAGSFIDMGYLAKRLAVKQLLGAKVDLCLMLPSGYAGHGKSRTEANTYAALMELETCIEQGPKFVKRWKNDEDPELPPKPYDEVFLFDTGNLALKKTAKATDLFDMVADILFEDFTSEEFANRKRSIAPNQSQYKIDSFSLPVDAQKYGKMKMMYSKAYSSFGQSIIDTQLEQRRDEIACGQVNDMLKVFFGIASDSGGGREVPPPTPDDGRDLLKKHFYCAKENFKLAYKFAAPKAAQPYEEGIEYPLHKLVVQLLYDGDKPILGSLHNKINQGIDKIRASTEKDHRLPLVDELRSELDRDLGIEGVPTDAGARGIEDAIKARRKSLFKDIVDDNSSLLKALWSAVDNKEKGGLDYTIKLIERIKDCIENDATGILRDIKTAQKWFSGLCEKLRGGELQVLRDDLGKTRGRSFFGGTKNDYAEDILTNIGEAIKWYVEARLREIACREAAVLLMELSSWLGQHQGIDERTNRKQWAADSFAGRLAGYEKLVIEIMSSMDEEVIRTREAAKQGHAAYQIVKASTAELDAARKLDTKKAMEWAKEIFDNLGGSRAIFQELEKDVSRAKLLGQLRGLALTKLPAIGSGEHNPLIKALMEMGESDRRSLFQHCLDMAMPWVEANLEGFWAVNPDQYSCVIGVSGAEIFQKKFGDEFKAAIPARARMTTKKVNFYETGVPGKLTCYVELSGVPLPALSLLSNWRDSYNEEGKKIPVHTHKDKTLFVHPMAPSSGTLDRLADHFKLYIRGVVLGVLKLRVDSPEERLYCLTVSGEELSIGNERTIRMEGIASEHLVYLQKKVAGALDRIKTTAQYAGLVALYDYYTKCVYPPAKIQTEDKVEILAEGFGNVMCASLGEEARKAMKKKSTVGSIDTAELIATLKGTNDDNKWDNFETLDRWTDEIDGSYADVYENEVGKAHMSKRILKQDFFQAGWLENCFKISVERISHDGRQERNEPPPLEEWWVALDGQKKGPHDESGLSSLIVAGRMVPSTKVWRKGMSKWVPAEQVKELDSLFHQLPPIDDEPPPID